MYENPLGKTSLGEDRTKCVSWAESVFLFYSWSSRSILEIVNHWVYKDSEILKDSDWQIVSKNIYRFEDSEIQGFWRFGRFAEDSRTRRSLEESSKLQKSEKKTRSKIQKLKDSDARTSQTLDRSSCLAVKERIPTPSIPKKKTLCGRLDGNSKIQKLNDSKTGISLSRGEIPNLSTSKIPRAPVRERARSRLFSRSLAAALARQRTARASMIIIIVLRWMTFSFVCCSQEPASLRFPRICTCTSVWCLCSEKISDRLSPTVYRLLPSLEIARAHIRIYARRYSSGFLSVTCKSISRLDLCYETDVSLVGGGVSASRDVHIYAVDIVHFGSILFGGERCFPPFGATSRENVKTALSPRFSQGPSLTQKPTQEISRCSLNSLIIQIQPRSKN